MQAEKSIYNVKSAVHPNTCFDMTGDFSSTLNQFKAPNQRSYLDFGGLAGAFLLCITESKLIHYPFDCCPVSQLNKAHFVRVYLPKQQFYCFECRTNKSQDRVRDKGISEKYCTAHARHYRRFGYIGHLQRQALICKEACKRQPFCSEGIKKCTFGQRVEEHHKYITLHEDQLVRLIEIVVERSTPRSLQVNRHIVWITIRTQDLQFDKCIVIVA